MTLSNIIAPAGATQAEVFLHGGWTPPAPGGGALYGDDVSFVDNSVGLAPVWNGGGTDNNFTDGANWGGTAPSPGSALTFGGSTRLTPNNDFPANTAFAGFTFNAGSGAFVIGGNAINLTGNIVNNSANLQTINTGLALQQNTTVNTASGNVTLGGAVSGAFSLTKTGNNTLTLSGTNSYGDTLVNVGTLTIAYDGIDRQCQCHCCQRRDAERQRGDGRDDQPHCQRHRQSWSG